ncbi:DUF1244 domain-containing protein [Flavobacterium sp. LC2016-01]|nr:DUF1244 domain-containing protein [Flavobacterium sp. LC2016-01]
MLRSYCRNCLSKFYTSSSHKSLTDL